MSLSCCECGKLVYPIPLDSESVTDVRDALLSVNEGLFIHPYLPAVTSPPIGEDTPQSWPPLGRVVSEDNQALCYVCLRGCFNYSEVWDKLFQYLSVQTLLALRHHHMNGKMLPVREYKEWSDAHAVLLDSVHALHAELHPTCQCVLCQTPVSDSLAPFFVGVMLDPVYAESRPGISGAYQFTALRELDAMFLLCDSCFRSFPKTYNALAWSVLEPHQQQALSPGEPGETVTLQTSLTVSASFQEALKEMPDGEKLLDKLRQLGATLET